jgi:hypothetical protein
MCGWSTGFFFAVVSRAYEQRGRERGESAIGSRSR